MENRSDFTTTLRAFMARARRSNSDLAQLTNISISTIEKWTSGIVRRPRFVADVLTLARALGLDTADTNTLLRAAAHPPLTALQAQAEQTGDRTLAVLLATWPPAAPSNPIRAASPAAAPPHAPCHQLRAPVADFVGRVPEVDQVVSVLRRAQAAEQGAIISGVQGMGGIGKTELAYAIAHQLRDAFPDAQHMLNLRGSSATPLTPQQTLQTVIHTLTREARLPDDLPALEQHYRTLLYNQRVLILADDAAGVVQVRALIPPAGSAVLITSRQRFSVPGMTTLDLEQLPAQAAGTLLRAICPRLNEAEAQSLAQACAYLPLALRVSGGILRNDQALSVAAYLAQLRDATQGLAQLRDPDDPQLDVAATLALSYTQLDAAAQQVFRQLGVFVADFATDLAVAVVQAPADVAVEATLRLLLRRNLVLYDAVRGRWRLHDLLRGLALRALEATSEAEATQWRYAHAVVQLAQQTQEQYLAGGESTLAALTRFDAERMHIEAGRAWAVEHMGTPEGDQLLREDAAATNQIGMLRYDVRRERIPLWEHALAAARRLGDRHAERMALNYLGLTYVEVGDARRAIPYYEQALSISRQLGDQRGEGVALNNLGYAYSDLGETRRAIPYFEQTLAITRVLGERRAEGIVLGNLGCAYAALGEVRHAIRCYEQHLTIAREIGDRRSEGLTLDNLGNAYTDLGNLERAIDSCTLGRAIAREIGDRRVEGYALSYLARAQVVQGDIANASTSFAQAVALFRDVGDRWGEAEGQWQFGLALAHLGERERAVPLLRAAVTYEQEIGHAKAAEHAALLERLEAGKEPTADLLHSTCQRAVGADAPPGGYCA